MNILLLSNSAPKYHYFFNALAELFIHDGATVVAAVDSKFSRIENGLDFVGFAAIHDFSAFFAGHSTDRAILARYSDYDLNGALLSDFERAQVYNIWGDAADIDYFDRLKSALLTYFEELIIHHAIDTVLHENVSTTFAHYALFVAQELGAHYCGLGSSRLPGRFSITADPLADDRTEAAFQAIRDKRLNVAPPVRKWVREYIAGIETIVPDYMNTNGLDRVSLLDRYFRRDRVAKVGSLLRHAFDDRTAAFQIGNPLRTYTNLFMRNVRRRMKTSLVRAIYQPAVPGERFLLYPLHFHPESSTSILAGTYLDEYEVIRNIAFSLPEGMRLYVKDHVSAWAYPTMDFYRRIRRLPNVRLLAPEEQTKRLIKKSEAVITLTSTVGYEALLLRKQVFVYGRVFYDFHTGVNRIDNPRKIRSQLTDCLRAPSSWDDKYNEDFVSAYYYTTRPGTINMMQDRVPARNGAERLYPIIAEVMQRHG